MFTRLSMSKYGLVHSCLWFLAGCGAPLDGASTNDQSAGAKPGADAPAIELGELNSELRSKYTCLSERAFELELLHTHWWLEGLELPTDSFGNTVVEDGKTVFMPLPDAPGDGTPGSIDVTLRNNDWFFLPLFGVFGTAYSDGTPPDPFEPISIFETLDVTFSIDGVPLVTTENVMDYFFQFELDPPIAYDAPPLAAVIWGEEVSVLHHPLSRGQHTLTLDVINTEPVWAAWGGEILEWHNTWNVTVVGKRKKH